MKHAAVVENNLIVVLDQDEDQKLWPRCAFVPEAIPEL
jgi:hypothetical protein